MGKITNQRRPGRTYCQRAHTLCIKDGEIATFKSSYWALWPTFVMLVSFGLTVQQGRKLHLPSLRIFLTVHPTLNIPPSHPIPTPHPMPAQVGLLPPSLQGARPLAAFPTLILQHPSHSPAKVRAYQLVMIKELI